MDQEELDRIRLHKYNDWGQRLPLSCNDPERSGRAFNSAWKPEFSPAAQSAIFVHELVNCRGFEFVAFSNAKIDEPLRLPYEVILYPCFVPQLEGTRINDPLAIATRQMYLKGEYIYDGWIPIADFGGVTVSKVLRHVGEALSVFPLLNQSYFEWEPKYCLAPSSRCVHHLSTTDLSTIEAFISTMDSINEGDRTAIFRSIAWLSQAGKTDDVRAKFLFAILAVESLATHIAEETTDDSPLAMLRSTKRTRSERKMDRENCVHQIMTQGGADPVKAVQDAYFTCIVGIRKRLQRHLAGLMGEGDADVLRFFQALEGNESLYELRHKIAHGTLDSLNEKDVMLIESNADGATQFALRYVWVVLQRSLNFYNQSDKMHISFCNSFSNAIISNPAMYQGPIDMALIYTH